MSNRYKGAVISATPPTTTGGEDGTASGAWTVEQQMQLQAAGLWPAQPTGPYIEQVFQTWLYTGNGSTQTITNGIDLSTKGGLVWVKTRSAAGNNFLFDTARGVNNEIRSNATNAQSTVANSLTAFNSNGFDIGSAVNVANNNAVTYASWTFREQPKFFDVVTYSGNSTAGNTVAHNLGSVPGTIIVKITSGSGSWFVYHRSLGATKYLLLDDTGTGGTSGGIWNNTEPTSSVFTLGNDGSVNSSGQTYVAYLFAHDAGGFGLLGTDNVISCGSFTNSGSSTATVNLGYEPQWLMVKSTVTAQNWFIFDTMRGMPWSSGANYLNPNTSSAETGSGPTFSLTATGFNLQGFIADEPYIYIAIRRGPMKVPTTGTSVFKVETYNQTSASDPAFNLGKVADAGLRRLSDFEDSWRFQSRLTGNNGLITSTSGAESTMNFGNWDNNVGWYQGASITPPYSQANWYGWTFARAPGFFDVVCYTGAGNGTTVAHNLGVEPELAIIKQRSGANDWVVRAPGTGANRYLLLNKTNAQADAAGWYSATSSQITFTTAYGTTAGSGSTYVGYLFASCAGVSKVGSYTGTGTTLQIDCGFTAGSRFVLIRRTDSTGDWYVWDSARGIVAGDDPYLLLNSTAAEVTGTDYVDTYAAGFEISSTAPAGINANGGTYIFLAIA